MTSSRTVSELSQLIVQILDTLPTLLSPILVAWGQRSLFPEQSFPSYDVGWCGEASGWSPRVKGSLDRRSEMSGYAQGPYVGARGGEL